MSDAPRIFDTFLFYNELDLLEVRLATLWDVADVFVVTECFETFSGRPKPMIFAENRERFERFREKIVYNPVTATELDLLKTPSYRDWVTDFALSLPHKHGGMAPNELHPSVQREITHRDAIILGLQKHAWDGDIVLMSDVDEIPAPDKVAALRAAPPELAVYFRMAWFLYWVNNKADQPWFGTVAAPFRHLKGRSVDLLRYATHEEKGVPGPVIGDGGWHFSYLGGAEVVANKLRSLAYQGRRAEISVFLNRLFPKRLEKMLKRNQDILLKGRDFEVVPFDESFPVGLRDRPDIAGKYVKAVSQ